MSQQSNQLCYHSIFIRVVHSCWLVNDIFLNQMMFSFEEVYYVLDINVDSYSISNCMLWRILAICTIMCTRLNNNTAYMYIFI